MAETSYAGICRDPSGEELQLTVQTMAISKTLGYDTLKHYTTLKKNHFLDLLLQHFFFCQIHLDN